MGAVKAAIGDIVLFKIDPSDFGISRPLLVTHVNDDESVEGEVFFNWELDRHREWPTKHLFYRLAKEQRTVQVAGVKAGEGIGEYKVKEMRERVQPIAPRTLVPEKRSR